MRKPTKKTGKLAQEILAGLYETLDFVKGNPTPGRVTLMLGQKQAVLRN